MSEDDYKDVFKSPEERKKDEVKATKESKKQRKENPKEEDDKRSRIKVPFLVHGKDDEIVIYESINIDKFPCFLSYNTKTKKFANVGEIDSPTEIFLPFGKDGDIPYQPYTFSVEELQNIRKNGIKQIDFAQMYKSCYKEFDDFLDLEEKYKHLEVGFLFETYLQHKINSTGYPFNIGEKDSGKTRALELLNFLAYRPLFGIKLGPANVYEAIGYRSEGSCTILEDEAQELSDQKDPKNADKLTIYRGGYKRGVRVPRIMGAGSIDRHMRYYYTFCCKSFSGYYLLLKDHAFNSRCIPIPFIAGHPKKDEIIVDIDIPRWNEMKKTLLLWRMINWAEPLPKLEVDINNRVKEVWKSKIQVASYYEKAYKIISEMALEAQTRKKKRLQNSLEAHIAKTLIQLEMANNWGEIEFTTIWNHLLNSLNVTNEDEYKKKKVYVDALGYDLSKTKIGTKLSQSFQGEPDFRHGKGRVWKFRKDVLQRLATCYGINKENYKH